MLQIFVIFTFGVVLCTPPPIKPEEAELQVLQGNTHFTTNLYKVLAEESKDNVFFSPISVHVVLSMAYQGAQGTTAQRFAETLHVPRAQIAANGYSAVMNRLNSVENVTLAMANRVYLMESAKMLENFKNAVTEKFLSEVQLVNFAKNEETAKIINNWVEKQTHDKIKDLVKKEALDALTKLVLVNAIYFKGNWKYQFNKKLTKTESFYVSDDNKVDVEMMHTYDHFNYKNDTTLDAQVLEMPYNNDELSMIIILPNKKNGIKKLEEELIKINLNEIYRDMQQFRVKVTLPKFKNEQTIDLENSLTKLGLGEIFDEGRANFSGIIELRPGDRLSVTKAIQKAFIEVNEEGAEAAAATYMAFGTRSARVFPEATFTADHPFIYIISGRKYTQLFMGRLTNPSL